MVRSAEARQRTAYHESGHALVAVHTPGALDIHKATIVPRGHALGLVAQARPQHSWDYSLGLTPGPDYLVHTLAALDMQHRPPSCRAGTRWAWSRRRGSSNPGVST